MKAKTKPSYYRRHVFICTNERPKDHPMPSCGRHGAKDFLTHMKDRVFEMGLEDVRINSAGCLGRCDNAPVMVIYPEGAWYRLEKKKDIDQILAEHIIKGKPIVHKLLADNK